MTGSEPLKIGDRVTIRADGMERSGCVLALSDWQWILARTDDGRLWLDVMMTMSAVSWSRLVLLDRGTVAGDLGAIDEVARAVAWWPYRDDVADVPGAERLCEPGEQLIRP